MPLGRSCGILRVEAPGDGIKVGGVGFGRGEEVGAGEGYCASVIDFDSEAFGQEAVRFCEGSGDDVREGLGDAGCWRWGRGVSLMAKKQREAKGRVVAGFEDWPTGWATSVAFAFFPFFPRVRPEPAA